MTLDRILTIDVGSTNCKVVLWEADGTVVGTATESYPTYYPAPGWVEQKPEEWWVAVVASVGNLVMGQRGAIGRVAAISVTGQMHGLVAMDSHGQVLGPCLTLRDQRSRAEAGEILAALGDHTVYHITGGRLDGSAPAAKLRWLRKHQEAIFRQAQVFLPCKDFIRYRLTGTLATDSIDAAGTLLYDVRRGNWAPTVLEASGVAAEKLPAVAPAWALAGKLTPEAAAALGLRAGTPVVVGGGDDVEILGAGLVNPGTSLEHLGTTGSILTCVDRLVLDPQMRLDVYPHVDPSRWVIGGSTSSAGAALAWAGRMLGNEELPQTLIGETTSVPSANPLVFLPYLAGERCPIWEPLARGAWLGLTMDHTRADMWRAVLEGIAFSLNHILETVEEVGVSSSTILATGSPDVSHFWAQLRADVYQRPLLLPKVFDPTSLGAMLLAGIGVGLFANLAEAIRKTVLTERTVSPSKEMARYYGQLYAVYKEASRASQPLFSQLATFQTLHPKG